MKLLLHLILKDTHYFINTVVLQQKSYVNKSLINNVKKKVWGKTTKMKIVLEIMLRCVFTKIVSEQCWNMGHLYFNQEQLQLFIFH